MTEQWIVNNCDCMGYLTVYRNGFYDTIGTIYRKENYYKPDQWYYIGLDVNNKPCIRHLSNY